MWWIWPVYVLILVVVTFLSVLLARYVDALDKKTQMSDGVLGGVLLAGVTSLPELITSFTAVLLFNDAQMTFGNIMGSNFFDITIIGVLMLSMFFIVKSRGVSKSTSYFIWLSFVLSAVILVFNIFNWQVVIPGININILSLIILAFYVFVLVISRKNKEEKSDEIDGEEVKLSEKLEKMPVKKIVLCFVIVAVLLVGSSVGLTYATEFIAENYEIGKGIAGALLLGIATSLPEVVSSIELVRLKNFDMAVGNLFGSCMFNYLILTLVDIFYFSGSVFTFGLQSIYFAGFMLFSTVAFSLVYILKRKKAKVAQSSWLYITIGALMVASYLACMILSAGL